MGSPCNGSASSEYSSSYQPSYLQYSQLPQYPMQLQLQIPPQVPQYNYYPYQQQTQVLDQSQSYVQPTPVPTPEPGSSHSVPSAKVLMPVAGYSPQASMASTTPTRSRLRTPRAREVAFRDFEQYFTGQHQQYQRRSLDAILASDWLVKNEMEPVYGNRSVLCDLLSAQDQNDGTLQCLFDGCTKHFDRLDRALAHIRVHLGHQPFSCEGSCRIPNW
jgi:hypothetical protein